MNQYPGLLIAGNNCGDNCSKWIQYIARTKDVRITLEHPMEFSDPFEAVCENTGKKLNSVMEYTDAYFEWRGSNSVNWDEYSIAGVHHVKVCDSTISYEFDLHKPITIIRGDSGSGKTILFDMVFEHYKQGLNSACTDVSIVCDKKCIALTDVAWRHVLMDIKDSVVFMGENSIFYEDRDTFIEAAKNSDNYYVLITRDNTNWLPNNAVEVCTIKEKKSCDKKQDTCNGVTLTYNELSRACEK